MLILESIQAFLCNLPLNILFTTGLTLWVKVNLKQLKGCTP